MPKWTRSERRRYREERQRQASRIADRLIGKKPLDWWDEPIGPDHGDFAMTYRFQTNMLVSSPRSSIQITGFTI